MVLVCRDMDKLKTCYQCLIVSKPEPWRLFPLCPFIGVGHHLLLLFIPMPMMQGHLFSFMPGKCKWIYLALIAVFTYWPSILPSSQNSVHRNERPSLRTGVPFVEPWTGDLVSSSFPLISSVSSLQHHTAIFVRHSLLFTSKLFPLGDLSSGIPSVLFPNQTNFYGESL